MDLVLAGLRWLMAIDAHAHVWGRADAATVPDAVVNLTVTTSGPANLTASWTAGFDGYAASKPNERLLLRNS